MKTIKKDALYSVIEKIVPKLISSKPYFYSNVEGYTLVFDINAGGQITYNDFTLLSKFFKTKKLSTSDYTHSGGCSTCDYGAKDTAVMYISEIPKESFEKLLKSLGIDTKTP